ncbi:MAG: hypothetical protein WAT22_09765 [Saprospiraceae bacterium]|nr:hypothetical protein [Saprospiraceae bacterium]MBP6445374.1 hypothetical protein [Saprospiraceae bacterium]
MKILITSILATMLVLSVQIKLVAQTKADSISTVFPKVLVVNDQKQVLLYYDTNRKAYEVPSMGTIDGPISYKSYIDSTAKDMGIEYNSLRMGGLFTYIYPKAYSTYIRPYFVIKFTKYSNHIGLADSTYKWFSYKDAVKEIPYPASSLIVEKILFQPKTVWGATFEEYGYTSPVDRTKIKFKILEDFFKLN